MDEFSENDIGKLLRLKRHEQPPPAYFENFIHEFHRRQRDELLREPLWRICLQRAHDFMFRLNVPSLASYPVAAAALLICAAVISFKVYQTPPQSNLATVSRQPVSVLNAAAFNHRNDWSLAKPIATRDFSFPLRRNFRQSAHAQRAAATPRYVLDSTPVSYEPAFNF
jgi:hypothetical protein